MRKPEVTLRNVTDTGGTAPVSGHMLDGLAIKLNCAECRLQEPDHSPQQGRFSHSIVTDNAEHFAVLLREVDVAQNRRGAIAGTDIPHLQDHCLACHCLPK